MKFDVSINESAFNANVESETHPVIESFLNDLRNRMIVSFNAPKRGREYKRGGRTHRASAPGEAPAVDFGTLQNSLAIDFPSPVSGVLEIGAEHSVYLTTGTLYMEPRPFIQPAIKGALESLGL